MAKTQAVLKLTLVALVVFLVCVWFFMLQPSVDPNWHKNIGLASTRVVGNVVHKAHGVPQQAHGATGDAFPSPQKVGENFPLVKGVHFLADYDVRNISMHPRLKSFYDTPADPAFRYIDIEKAPYHIELLSYAPRVLYVKNFMTPAECAAIRDAALPKMVRSEVAVYKGGQDKSPVSDVRTSSQTWMGIDEPSVKPIVDRILHLTGFPPGSSEMLQVLRYNLGQKYDSHNDYFDPQLYGKQASNRAATVFLYLTDVEEGGETHFPRADGKPITSYMKCSDRGLKVKPKMGSVAIFYDMTPSRGYDAASLHGGCPVIKGEKVAGTLWLRVQTP